jgi:hypothetical protein
VEKARPRVKQAYKFIAGNSRITPIGIALAVVYVVVFRHGPQWQTDVIFIAILLATLAASMFEPVQ